MVSSFAEVGSTIFRGGAAFRALALTSAGGSQAVSDNAGGVRIGFNFTAGSTRIIRRSLGKLGQYHCNNRAYDINSGRWISPDQASSPWWDLFEYGEHQPVHITDPTGLMSIRISETFTKSDSELNEKNERLWDAFKKLLKKDKKTDLVDSDISKKNYSDDDSNANKKDILDHIKNTEKDDVFAYFGHGCTSGCMEEHNAATANNWIPDKEWQDAAKEAKGTVLLFTCYGDKVQKEFSNAKCRIFISGYVPAGCLRQMIENFSSIIENSFGEPGLSWAEVVDMANASGLKGIDCCRGGLPIKFEKEGTGCDEKVVK